MYAFLIIVHVIASLILIMVILLQAGRGGGLSETFGSSVTQSFLGTSATKFLQKATAVSAIVFLLTCLSLAALSTHRSRSLMHKQRLMKVLDDAMQSQTESAGSPAQEAPTAEEVPAAGKVLDNMKPGATE
ncbi:MAG: preprotein translocase subunit SecG [Candidatus Omnitrophota bacterium]